MPALKRPWAWLEQAALALCLLAAPAVAQPDSQELDVFEEVAIVEREVIVEFPDLGGSASNLGEEDLVVTEGGEVRQVVGVFPLDAERAFDVRIVFDQVLSSDETLLLARQALEAETARLTRLGPVSVMHLLDGEAVTETVALDASSLSETLARTPDAEASARWRTARTVARRASFDEAPGADAATRHADLLRAQAVARFLHRLEALAVTGCEVPPCLLFLASEGFLPKEASLAATSVEQLGKLFAAYGWSVVSMPLRPPGDEPSQERRPSLGTDFETWTRAQGGVSVGPSQTGRRSRLAPLDASGYDVYILPRYEALRHWAQATGGGILARAEQLGPETRRFGRRYRLRYLAEPAREATLLPLEVDFLEESPYLARRRLARATGFAKEETLLRAPTFARSGWPGASSVWLHDVSLVLRAVKGS